MGRRSKIFKPHTNFFNHRIVCVIVMIKLCFYYPQICVACFRGEALEEKDIIPISISKLCGLCGKPTQKSPLRFRLRWAELFIFSCVSKIWWVRFRFLRFLPTIDVRRTAERERSDAIHSTTTTSLREKNIINRKRFIAFIPSALLFMCLWNIANG